MRECVVCGSALRTTRVNTVCCSAACRAEVKREYHRQYYVANCDALRESQRRYREVNRDVARERQRRYREANREAERKRHRQYDEVNREVRRERQRRYYEANREARREYARCYYAAHRPPKREPAPPQPAWPFDAVAYIHENRLGSKVARACGISRRAINHWRRVPPKHAITVEQALGIARQLIRPDIFPPDDVS